MQLIDYKNFQKQLNLYQMILDRGIDWIVANQRTTVTVIETWISKLPHELKRKLDDEIPAGKFSLSEYWHLCYVGKLPDPVKQEEIMNVVTKQATEKLWTAWNPLRGSIRKRDSDSMY